MKTGEDEPGFGVANSTAGLRIIEAMGSIGGRAEGA